MDNHSETNLSARIKVIVSRIRGKFSGSADAEKVLDIMNDAGRIIGLQEKITGVGSVLGNVIILDLRVPVKTATALSEASRFNMAVANKLVTTYGALNVGYVSAKPMRRVTVTIETDKSEKTLNKRLSKLGTIVS
jgi:hypothetical protein